MSTVGWSIFFIVIGRERLFVMMLTSDGHKKSMFGEMIFGSVSTQIRFGLAKTIPTMGLT